MEKRYYFAFQLWSSHVTERLKKVVKLICTFLYGLVFPITVNANLINIFDGNQQLTYDNVANLYWYYDLQALTNKTIYEQKDFASSLNQGAGYFNIKGWHMANQFEIDTLRSKPLPNVGNTFAATGYHPRGLPGANPYWQGRYDRLWAAGDGTDYWAHNVAFAPWHPPVYIDADRAMPGLNRYNDLGAWLVSTESPTVPDGKSPFLS